MPGPEEQIESSVGWVLSSHESVSFAGSAFLFRQEGTDQYWFTCHHVVMDLPQLFIRIALNGKSSIRPARYVKENSVPGHDIAVLRTSERDWADLKPIPMGDPFRSRPDPHGYRLFLYGHATDQGSGLPLPRSIRSPFVRHDHGYYYLKASSAAAAESASPTAATGEWQVRATEPLAIATYELQEQGHHLLSGLSGAPVCYLLDGEFICFGMFSQIWYGPLSDPQGGVAIKFNDLLSAAGPLIPLYPYADCLIVTVAATRDEIIDANKHYQVGDEPSWWLHSAQELFYDNSRDSWRPFGDGAAAKMSVVDLISQGADSSITCQFISDYAGAPDDIQRIITHSSGIVFILDPCSPNIGTLGRIFDVANQARWKAAYLLACCELRVVDARLRAAMAEALKGRLREVTSDPLCGERLLDVRRVEEFTAHIVRLIDSTVNIGLATWKANPHVKRRLAALVARVDGIAADGNDFIRRLPTY
jgi:hypothetical protein